MDSDLRRAVDESFGGVVHMEKVEDVKGSLFEKILARRDFKAIIVGGGSPCQGNSSLNKGRKGLRDPRSRQPEQLARIVEELGCLEGCPPILKWIENVASAPDEVVSRYSALIGSRPILIDAARFGWVSRRRLYWGHGPAGGVSTLRSPVLPPMCSLVQNKGEMEVVYDTTANPIPARLTTGDGFEPAIRPGKVLSQEGWGAMYTFTRDFEHTLDRGCKASEGAVSRWQLDGRRFPPEAYEQWNLLWKGDTWRTYTDCERATIHGIPPALVQAVRGGNEARGAKANSAVGNGFHIPSVMLFFLLLLQMVDSAAPGDGMIPYSMEESELRLRMRGTVFEPGVMGGIPVVMKKGEVVAEMQHVFRPLADEVGELGVKWVGLMDSMVDSDLAALQIYVAYKYSEGWRSGALGPEWREQKDKARAWAAGGIQRASGNSKRGLSYAVQPGVGKEEHMRRAVRFQSPFNTASPIDDDIAFAIYAVMVWGPFFGAWQTGQQRAMERVLAAMEPARMCLAKWMPPDVAKVASKKNPMAVALVTVLLRWPDRALAGEYVLGHKIVGHQPSSGLFREISQEEIGVTELQEGFFGQAAEDYIDEILRSPPPRESETIEQMVNEEELKGYQSRPASSNDMRRKFGKGNWRPMPLFLHKEGSGKNRLIADGKRGHHNRWTSEEETLFVIAVDFVTSVAAAYREAIVEKFEGKVPWWAYLALGTDDMIDAFRQSPVHGEQLGANVVAFYSVARQRWLFAIVYGMVYGMRSAVLHFNRFPTLAVAAARRIGAVCCGAYFDDITTLECTVAVTSQNFVNFVVGALGGQLGPKKSMPARRWRVMLGVHVRLDEALEEGFVTYEPRDETIQKIAKAADERVSEGSCTPAQASKLRGLGGWAAGSTFRRCARLAMVALKRRQQSLDGSWGLDENMIETMNFLKYVLPRVPPRRVELGAPERQPIKVYSDASWECKDTAAIEAAAIPPRLGWVIIMDDVVLGRTMALPQEIVDTWIHRKTQIFAAEAVVPILAMILEPDIFKGKDVVWFIDNEPAVSSLIRGSTKAEDVGHLAAAAQIQALRLGAAVWFEWVASDDNPSDGLSRGGLTDPWTIRQGWSLHEFDKNTVLSTFSEVRSSTVSDLCDQIL